LLFSLFSTSQFELSQVLFSLQVWTVPGDLNAVICVGISSAVEVSAEVWALLLLHIQLSTKNNGQYLAVFPFFVLYCDAHLCTGNEKKRSEYLRDSSTT
jgi:hypothetical protein